MPGSIWCSPQEQKQRPPDLYIYLFFLSSLFLHISVTTPKNSKKNASNVEKSVLKELDDIELLPPKFFEVVTTPPDNLEDMILAPEGEIHLEETDGQETIEAKLKAEHDKKFMRWFVKTERTHDEIIEKCAKKLLAITHDMRAQCLLQHEVKDSVVDDTNNVWRKTFENFAAGAALPLYIVSPQSLPKNLAGSSMPSQQHGGKLNAQG